MSAGDPPVAAGEDADVGLRVLSGEADADGNVPTLVSAVPPKGSRRTPSDLCCVVDVSGSMNNQATIQSDTDMEGPSLCVLEIVIHATKTIIRNLQDDDRLALVTYSTEAQTIFDLTVMDEEGRKETEKKVQALNALGMTNLWDGLKTGLDVLKAGSQPGRLQHIMLFTDGQPNINPPRGILPMLQRRKTQEGGQLPCTISTFGFGYELDSGLLMEIATIGCGSYGFIPDAGFVGTVFVHAMANLLVTMAKDVTLIVEPAEGVEIQADNLLKSYAPYILNKTPPGGFTIDFGTLQYGQSKDVVFSVRAPPEMAAGQAVKVSLNYRTRNSSDPVTCDSAHFEGPGVGEIDLQRCRLLFANAIRSAMEAASPTSVDKAAGKEIGDLLPRAQSIIQDVVDEISAMPAGQMEEHVEALLEDLQGQAAEAFSREDWYTKWGQHYLPSLLSAHLLQMCNNFKDPGVQKYGGELFEDLRDKADDVFLSLPAPVSRNTYVAPSASPPAPVPMAAYHDRFGG